MRRFILTHIFMGRMVAPLIFIFAFLLVGTHGLFAYNSRITAEGVTRAPVIDGDLGDPVWQESLLFSDFKMVKPTAGNEPSEKTHLRVMYDSRNLYIGVYCFDADAGSIAVNDLSHDLNPRGDGGNDLIRILLDPFQDKRNAYVFIVNPKGARTDGLASGGQQFSSDWDGIWDAKTKIHADGWSTEIRIPFKTLSFNPRLSQWGFNVERYIARKMEVIRLSGVTQNSFFYNPAEAALLDGLKDIKQGKGLTFKPYASLEMGRVYGDSSKREWKVNGGFDLYKNFTPNLVGVFTYLTDFAETEVDDRRINLTRFSLFYPEKRAFFLEGSDIFKFEGGEGSFGSSFVPFFSRRIGLYDEEQVPILWGAKVYGKIGNTNVALLDVRTKSFNETAGQNFFAGRVYQNIFTESKIGLIFTSGQPGSEATNTLLGLDFNYTTSRFLTDKNVSLSGWWATNKNSRIGGKHYGYGANLEYPNDLVEFKIGYNYLGDALEPGLGFVPRNGVQQVHANFQFKPRPVKGLLGKLVRQISYRMFTSFYWDLEGRALANRISICPFTFIRGESGDSVEFYVIPQRDVLDEPFEISEGVIIPPGDYQFTRYQYHYVSATHRMLTGKVEYETGGFYSGKLSKLDMRMAFNLKGNLKLGLEGLFIRGRLPEGNFNENLYRLKADFYVNPDLGLMTYFQYDSVSENIGANIRFKWRISPGNTVYLVYNKSWERRYHPETRFFPLEDRGVFKLQFTWRP